MMENNIQSISEKLHNLVTSNFPFNSEVAEMRILDELSTELLSSLESDNDIKRALMNMFLVGQIHTNKNSNG